MNVSPQRPLMQPLSSAAVFYSTPSPISDSAFQPAQMPSVAQPADGRRSSFRTSSADSRLSDSKSFSSPTTTVDGSTGKNRSKSGSSANLKRKRDTESTQPAAPPPDEGADHPDHPKRKKANRACFACQKAHLTCDDNRPCQRCVRKGCADQCIEGHRKKAKYLLEDEELEAIKKAKEEEPSESAQQTSLSQPNYLPSDPLFTVPLDPAYTFASDQANLEYNMLSAILGGPDPHPYPAQSQNPVPSISPEDTYQMMWSNQALPTSSAAGPSTSNGATQSPYSFVTSSSFTTPVPQPSSVGSGFLPSVLAPQTNGALVNGAFSSRANGEPSSLSRTLMPPSPPTSNDSPNSSTMQAVVPQHQHAANGFVPSHPVISGDAGAEVYHRVNKGYDYTEGYHFLMKFLTDRFEKNDILRVVRALAIFRPSLIALQMPLSPEDEIFLEKSFQRTLIELDKLISFSGTPTVIWRRTGEICLVGVEFTVLTDWTKEDLLSGRKYIYELFEDQSVVEYWEKFASHAFENSSQSVYTHCVLLKPDGSPLPCAFCFSIRRDIFDLPSVVIGQWLPLL